MIQNPEEPKWRQDFPIKAGEDGYATRREFTKFLGLTSIAFFLGTCWAAARRWLNFQAIHQAAPVAVAKTGEIAAGGYKVFHFPDEENGEPCILVRLDETTYSAFTQNCTHLCCPVHFKAERKELICPCHDGCFSAIDGKALAGPPKRGLTKLAVTERGGQLWVGAAVPEKEA